MKKTLALAVLVLPSLAAAAPLESLSAAAERGFLQAPDDLRAALAEPPAQEPVLQPPLTVLPRESRTSPGAEAGRVGLAFQLDRNLHLMNYKFGARPLDLGVAIDAGSKSYFLAFSDAETLALAQVKSLNDLRGSGVDARIDSRTVYNFKVSINIFSPVRGSTLHMTPVRGTVGPRHDPKTGLVLDAIKAHSAVIVVSGEEYWISYGRDAKADGSGLADTRSFLIMLEAGTSSKVWPLAESALQPDVPSQVDLNGAKVWFTRTSGGQLVVNEDK